MTYLKLLLIRHAQSLGNAALQMEGQGSTALSALGRQQAQRLAAALLRSERPTHCYSSPLLRSRQTAAALTAAYPPLTVTLADPLQELHAGILQGLTWAEATVRYPDLCQRLMQQLDYWPVPQAEPLSAGRARAQRWLTDCLKQHQPGDVIWAVSHAGLMQHLIAAVLGCDRTWQIPIQHTAVFEFWLAQTAWTASDRNRFNPEFWQIRRFNDTAHLL
ncbi:MAG: histidine phosphatase family protein [Leptolyngbya sp. SIO4C1]|nr:histidine phosphatase family protein [Leptolyngbya sp. SIO4C1]